jgi:hypothetical protein
VASFCHYFCGIRKQSGTALLCIRDAWSYLRTTSLKFLQSIYIFVCIECSLLTVCMTKQRRVKWSFEVNTFVKTRWAYFAFGFKNYSNIGQSHEDSSGCRPKKCWGFVNMKYDMCMIWYDIFVNCNWVVTRWQKYSTHLHKNNTQNDTKQTICRTTQQFWKSEAVPRLG